MNAPPEHLVDSIQNYVMHGTPPGSFLYAVLSNNLFEAVGRADDFNIRLLPEIVNYCYNNIPQACWGSRETVKKWIEKH